MDDKDVLARLLTLAGPPQTPGVENASPHFVPGGLPTVWQRMAEGVPRTAYEMTVPQTGLDAALMLMPLPAAGPVAKALKGAAQTGLLALQPSPTQKPQP